MCQVYYYKDIIFGIVPKGVPCPPQALSSNLQVFFKLIFCLKGGGDPKTWIYCQRVFIFPLKYALPPDTGPDFELTDRYFPEGIILGSLTNSTLAPSQITSLLPASVLSPPPHYYPLYPFSVPYHLLSCKKSMKCKSDSDAGDGRGRGDFFRCSLGIRH